MELMAFHVPLKSLIFEKNPFTTSQLRVPSTSLFIIIIFLKLQLPTWLAYDKSSFLLVTNTSNAANTFMENDNVHLTL